MSLSATNTINVRVNTVLFRCLHIFDYADKSLIYKSLILLYYRREPEVQRLVGQVTDSEVGTCLQGIGYTVPLQAKNEVLC